MFGVFRHLFNLLNSCRGCDSHQHERENFIFPLMLTVNGRKSGDRDCLGWPILHQRSSTILISALLFRTFSVIFLMHSFSTLFSDWLFSWAIHTIPFSCLFADFLLYVVLQSHPESSGVRVESWSSRVRAAAAQWPTFVNSWDFVLLRGFSLLDFPQADLVSLIQLVFEPPASLGIAGNLYSHLVPFPVLCPLWGWS